MARVSQGLRFVAVLDQLAIHIDNPSGWQMPNLAVYVAASGSTFANANLQITGVSAPLAMKTYVCHTGATLGTACGLVNSYQTSNYTWDVTMRFCAGDSGGPVYAAGQGYGIAVGGLSSDGNTTSVYDHTTQPCWKHTQYVDLTSILAGFGAGMTVD